MKEATGELNMSVIVFAAVALLAAFFFTVIWPNVSDTLTHQASCADAICDVGYNTNHFAYCYMPGKKAEVFECPYRG